MAWISLGHSLLSSLRSRGVLWGKGRHLADRGQDLNLDWFFRDCVCVRIRNNMRSMTRCDFIMTLNGSVCVCVYVFYSIHLYKNYSCRKTVFNSVCLLFIISCHLFDCHDDSEVYSLKLYLQNDTSLSNVKMFINSFNGLVCILFGTSTRTKQQNRRDYLYFIHALYTFIQYTEIKY